jgi:hypothetical protein
MAYTTINKPTDYFNTKLYTGNGSAGNAITGVGFQPDFVWLKQRNGTEYHNFYDAIRGVTKRLSTQPAGAAQSTISGLTAFGSDGFTVGAADTANQNSKNFVAWNWKETATAGFDIVSYTGTGSAKTVSHNLGVVPEMIIVKRYNDGTASWMVYHKSLGATASNLGKTKYLSLDATAAEDNGHWNDTVPTSSVFSVGTDQRVNANGAYYIAYCFAGKTGYSKFGFYNANENTNGPFVYCGFKPAFVLIKQTNLTRDWFMFDNKRDPSNFVRKQIEANSSGAEDAYDNLDFLSNGFKIKTTSATLNDASGKYIYMAFAEAPLVGSNGVTAKAR